MAPFTSVGRVPTTGGIILHGGVPGHPLIGTSITTTGITIAPGMAGGTGELLTRALPLIMGLTGRIDVLLQCTWAIETPECISEPTSTPILFHVQRVSRIFRAIR